MRYEISNISIKEVYKRLSEYKNAYIKCYGHRVFLCAK